MFQVSSGRGSTVLDVCVQVSTKESPLRWRCTISPVFFKHKVRGTEWHGDGRESGSRDYLLLDSIDADASYSYVVL